ncbi:MAG: type I phosphomannose isomerase catalytic subunit [Clostridium sp.]|uniref:type I phosphomannose isomerase catalytic subunit n=1 Tax=Clostridium TaxID=1485 RepID=UPI0021533ABD|nr:type I phosphomannose isomerase catalytic subunit [Clostridium sp. LY3-2]MCR6515124.1 class I mannose-6-phosphate isomerase [Clostridium sp. LY3-2]
MYPIKFENLYYERIWGGRGLEKFRDNMPSGVIGESWDIACHRNGTGIIENGELKGMSFSELIKKYGNEVVGDKMDKETFPLLIKLITADDKLSVQVHPDDEYAKKIENDLGKTEAWYVVDAEPNASLIVGTKNCDKETFKKAIELSDLDPYLNKIPVKKGDMFYVKSGLVHAICEGVTIAEIQQSSDTTYRVYDYNRGREIHVEKALDVIDFSLKGENIKGVTIHKEGFDKTILCLSEFFTIQKYEVKETVTESSDKDRFYLFTCVDGEGKIEANGTTLDIKFGDSFLIPAYLGEYTLKGEFTLLKSYVPDLLKEKEEIVSPILF